MNKVSKFEEQKVRTPKLSEAIRAAGYTCGRDYDRCVLGCAYRARFGGSLKRDTYLAIGRVGLGPLPFTELAADAFDVPYAVVNEAELMCLTRNQSPTDIADYVASQGY